MRLLLVGHAYVLDVNRAVGYELSDAFSHEVHIVAPRTWSHEYSHPRISCDPRHSTGIDIHPIPVLFPGSINGHFYASRIRTLLRKLRPDAVVIEEEPYSASCFQWSVACSLLRIPYVFTTLQNITKRYPFPIRIAERLVWIGAGMALPVTEAIESTLRERGYDGRTQIVPLAVDLTRFGAQADQPRSARLSLGYVGRLVPEKGTRLLLDVYRRLRATLDIDLVVLGSGPDEQLFEGEPGVELRAGLKHDTIPDHLQSIDVLLMPSETTPRWKEQFGRAAVEAMAAGIPVVGSDSGSLPEVIGRCGGGCIFPEGNEDLAYTAVHALLTDDSYRRRLAEVGRVGAHLYGVRSVAAMLDSALASALRT